MHDRNRSSLILPTLVGILGLALASTSVRAATVTISCPTGSNASPTSANDARACIQAAVDSASANDTLIFPALTYNIQGTVNVTKPLTLLGANADVAATGSTRGSGETKFCKVTNGSYGASWTLIGVQSGGVTINGFELDGDSDCGAGSYGIVVPGMSSPTSYQYLTFSNNWIHLGSSATADIALNQNATSTPGPLSDITIDHNYIYAPKGVLINLSGGGITVTNLTISNNTLSNTTARVLFGAGSYYVHTMTMTNNVVNGGTFNIGNITNGTITGNYFNSVSTRGSGGYVGIDTGTITGNNFTTGSPSNPIAYLGLWGTTYYTDPSQKLTIRNNAFDSGSVFYLDDPGVDINSIHFVMNSMASPVGTLNCANETGALVYGLGTGTLDATYNWWGAAEGSQPTYFCDIATPQPDPWISAYTADPTKAGRPGFWPLITTETSVPSASPEPSSPSESYTVSGTLKVDGIGTAGVTSDNLAGQVGVSDGTNTCTSSLTSLAASKDVNNLYSYSCEITPSTPLSAGDVTVTATYTDSSTPVFYNTSTNSASHSIAKLSNTINWGTTAPTSAAYGTSFGVTASATSSLDVTITGSGGCSGTGTGSATITMTSGTTACTVTASQGGNGSYAAATDLTATVTASQLTLTITPDGGKYKGYGADFSSLYSGTVTGLLNGDHVDVTYTSPGGVPSAAVGTYDITVASYNFTSGSATNYSIVENTAKNGLTVNPAEITVTASSPTVTYGSPKPAITPSYSGWQNGESSSVLTTIPTCSTTYTPTTPVNTSPAPTTSCTGAVAPNNTFIYVNGTVTINQATQNTLNLKVNSPASAGSTQNLSTSGGSGTGAVTYDVDGSTACTVSGNKLTITAGTGSCSVTATKAADTNYLVATATGSVTVQAATVNISISNLPKSGVYGNTFTALYKYTGDGTTSVTSSTPLICSTAGSLVNFIGVGTCTLTSSATATSNYNAATGNAQSFNITKATPALTLSSTHNPSTYGDAVDFITATIPASLTGAYPTGNVTFFDGKANLGTAALASGSATLSVSKLPVGTHSITATYAGDTNFTNATSNAVAQTVTKADPTVNLVSSFNPSTFGSSVTFSATVSGPGILAPSGPVTFLDEATTLGSKNLAGGAASLSTKALTVGGHTITVSYAGDANYNGGTTYITQTVSTATPTVTLTVAPNPAKFGTNVTLTATVPANASGSVTFYDGTNTLGSVAVVKGSAKLVTKTLSKGGHTISSSYSGDSNYAANTSNTVSETIN